MDKNTFLSLGNIREMSMCIFRCRHNSPEIQRLVEQGNALSPQGTL